MRKITFDSGKKVRNYGINLLKFGVERCLIKETFGEGLTTLVSNYYIRPTKITEASVASGIPIEKDSVRFVPEGIVLNIINLFPEKEEIDVFIDPEKAN